MKTVDFLDALKRVHALPSDYAAAQILGITRAQVSKYRNGRDFMGDEVALKVAELLALEPGYVAACAHAERAASEGARSMWESVAKRLQGAGVAGAVALSLFGFSGGPDGGAKAADMNKSAHVADGSMCLMSTIRRILRSTRNSLIFKRFSPHAIRFA